MEFLPSIETTFDTLLFGREELVKAQNDMCVTLYELKTKASKTPFSAIAADCCENADVAILQFLMDTVQAGIKLNFATFFDIHCAKKVANYVLTYNYFKDGGPFGLEGKTNNPLAWDLSKLKIFEGIKFEAILRFVMFMETRTQEEQIVWKYLVKKAKTI